MEVKFSYNMQDGCFLVAIEDAPGYAHAGFKGNYDEGNVVAGVPFEDGRPIHGLLRIEHYRSNSIIGDGGAAKLVCRENSLFQIDAQQFSIEDKHLVEGGALSKAIYFKIAGAGEMLRIATLRYTYWQIRILMDYLQKEGPVFSNTGTGTLTYCDGLIFRKANSDEYHLSSVRLTESMPVTWVSAVPEPIFSNQFGDVFLFDPHVRKDELLISSNVLLQVQ